MIQFQSFLVSLYRPNSKGKFKSKEQNFAKDSVLLVYDVVLIISDTSKENYTAFETFGATHLLTPRHIPDD